MIKSTARLTDLSKPKDSGQGQWLDELMLPCLGEIATVHVATPIKKKLGCCEIK